MEAILVAGGSGTRLGAASGGMPKPLVSVGGRPLAAHMVSYLAAYGVDRVVVNCARGTGALFQEQLAGLGPEIVVAEEPKPLGRGGGVRFASDFLQEPGPFFAVYGDELLDIDFAALLARHQGANAQLTVTAAPLTTPFGVLDIADDGQVLSFAESPKLPHWVNVGVYVLERGLVARLPAQGDAEQELFPALAREGRLYAYRHAGVWLTVNTPKDLARADRYLRAHPDWPKRKSRRLGTDFGRLRTTARRAVSREPLATRSPRDRS